ncbi:MAG: HAMP domain-containing histidine kinase [Dehalococcoidales bacterium]|nr:HAMP domain-containing histidine kinase [Dehalococcoidales bacterium]
MEQYGRSKMTVDAQQEIELLQRLADIPARVSDVAQAYHTFAQESKRYVGADWVAAVLVEGDQVRICPLDGESARSEVTLKLTETTLGEVISHREITVERVSGAILNWLGCPHQSRFVIWLPLAIGDDVLGALAVVSYRPVAYTKRQLALLKHITSLLVQVVYNLKLRKENEVVRQQDLERTAFIDVLVHELKTPLTSIIASIGLLEEELDGKLGQVQARIVENIDRSSQNLNSRISELADLAKARTGAFRLHTESSAIGPILKGAVAQVMPIAQSKGQALSLHLPRWLPQVVVDRRRLEQVMLNLLSNAIKFTPRGGNIMVRVEVGSGDVIVEVQDSGKPISHEEQRRLFEPYYRVEADRQRLPGLGLGLAVSKQLVEAHGGEIWVKSKVGEGNTFIFTIPYNNLAPKKPGAGKSIAPESGQ